MLRGLSAVHSGGHRVDHKFAGLADVDGMADDAARKAVQYGRAVQLSFFGPMLGDVGDPQQVRAFDVEDPPDQVLLGRSFTRFRCPLRR